MRLIDKQMLLMLFKQKNTENINC